MMIDAVDYIRPELMDIMLSDVKSEDLKTIIAEKLGVDYLSLASDDEKQKWTPLTAKGLIHGGMSRLIINLVTRRQKNPNRFVNVIFIVDTGSPYSFVSAEAMQEIVGVEGSNLPNVINADIGGHEVSLHLSMANSHFHDVNVLGMDALKTLNVYPLLVWVKEKFYLRDAPTDIPSP
jgi:hypothetical protein